MSQGSLYILHHHSFAQYGTDVYKFGLSTNLEQRLKSYTTSFLDKARFLYTSKTFHDCHKAEKILFAVCEQERIQRNREFFKMSLEKAVGIIKNLEQMSEQELDLLYKRIVNNLLPDHVKYSLRNEAHKIKERPLNAQGKTFTNVHDLLDSFRYTPK